MIDNLVCPSQDRCPRNGLRFYPWEESSFLFEPCHEKTFLLGLRPGPTQTELYNNRRWLEIFAFRFYFFLSENKSNDQLHGYRGADLRLCFRICKDRFPQDAAHLQ